ncbi:MAG: ATP-binding protein [Myxococcaceae bacterium]
MIKLFLVVFLLVQVQFSQAASRSWTVTLPTVIASMAAAVAGFPVIFAGTVTYLTMSHFSPGPVKPELAQDAATASYAKLIKLQVGVGVFMQLFEIALFRPFLLPPLESYFTSLSHPRLLQGEHSLTYIYRDKLKACDNPVVASMLKALPIDVCKKKKKTVRLEELVFADDVKSEITNFEILTRQRLRHGQGLPNLFLHGPAGTGKTALAEALADSLGFNFQRFTGSEIVKNERGIEELSLALKWGENPPATAMSALQDERPVLFFIDEIEHFVRSRKGDMLSREYQALAEFLGLINNSGSTKYMIVVASNLPDKIQIEEAIVSRFDLNIEIKMPGFAEREKIFELYLKSSNDFKKFAEVTEGFSARDIRVVCDNLIQKPATDDQVMSSIERLKLKRAQLLNLTPNPSPPSGEGKR